MEDLAEFSPEDAENGKLEEILATHGVTDVMAFIENAKKDVKELQMDLKETCKVLAAEASNPNNKNSKLFQMVSPSDHQTSIVDSILSVVGLGQEWRWQSHG